MVSNVIIFSTFKLHEGNSAGSQRTLNYAKLLADSGVNVYFSYISAKCIKETHINKVTDSIFSIEPESANNKIYLFRNFFKSFIYVFRIVKFAKKLNGSTSFILYPSPDPTLELPAILIIKWIYKYCLFCEINELRTAVVQSNWPISSISFRYLAKFLYTMLRYCYLKLNEHISRCFDGLIVISTRLETYYSKYNNNIIRIPILVDCMSISLKPSKPFDQSKDLFIISFTGQNEIRKEGLDILIKALSLLCDDYPNFQLHLYGPSPKFDKQELNCLINTLHLEKKIVFHGNVPQDSVLNILQNSHLLVLLRPSNLQNDYGFSTKLGEYMISGTPVLLSDVSDNKLYLKDDHNSFIIDIVSENEIASKIKSIITDYNNTKDRISESCLNTAKQYFDYRNYHQRLTTFLSAK